MERRRGFADDRESASEPTRSGRGSRVEPFSPSRQGQARPTSRLVRSYQLLNIPVFTLLEPSSITSITRRLQ